MHCPQCNSSENKKNGFRRGKQSYQCKNCSYQYVETPKARGYPVEVKKLCLKMYLNGMGFRAIARVTQIDHTTIINWVREEAKKLPNEPQEEEIPEITEIDELQTPTHPEGLPGGMRGAFRTFVGRKQKKYWIWTVVNHANPGILFWTIGDRSHQTFEKIWQVIKCWKSFWSSVLRRLTAEPAATAKRYVTDGYPVYPSYIEPEDHLVCKTYMTRVEGENTRLRHYLARLHRKTLCYSKSVDMLQYSIRLLLFYLKFHSVSISV
jgi:insertion element IS1 protein InsB